PLLRLRSQESSMHPSLLKVRDVIVQSPERSAALTIDDLSEQAGVSKATVVRFCKSLGYSGFREFRAALLKEAARSEMKLALAAVPDVATPVGELARVFAASVDELLRVLDRERFESAVDRLGRAKQIVWYGTG